jgi:YidC/Oxa1 family membrane protein insertase
MEKRTLLAIILSMAILFGWGILFDQTKIKTAPEPKPAPQAAAPSQPAQAPKAIDVASAATPQTADKTGSSIIVDTPLYTAAFNTKGAQIVSLKLKKYLTTMAKDAKPVEIIKAPMPNILLSGGFSDAGLVYESSLMDTVTLVDKTQVIEFRAQASPGITLKKVFTIDPKTYQLGYQAVIENHTSAPMAVSGEILFDKTYPLDEKIGGYAFEGPVLLNGKHLEEFKLDKVKTIGSYRDFAGEIQWFGFEDKIGRAHV